MQSLYQVDPLDSPWLYPSVGEKRKMFEKYRHVALQRLLTTSLTIYAAGSVTISLTLMEPVSPVSSVDTGTATSGRGPSSAAAKPSPGTLRGKENCRIRHQTKPDKCIQDQLIKGRQLTSLAVLMHLQEEDKGVAQKNCSPPLPVNRLESQSKRGWKTVHLDLKAHAPTALRVREVLVKVMLYTNKINWCEWKVISNWLTVWKYCEIWLGLVPACTGCWYILGLWRESVIHIWELIL